MPPTEIMDMAGKSSTASAGDTGVSREGAVLAGPPRAGAPDAPQGLTWGGEGDEEGPTSVEGTETEDSGGTWGWGPGAQPHAPIALAPSTLISHGCPAAGWHPRG